MALLQSLPSAGGFMATYHRIDTIDLKVGRRITVGVASYADEGARRDNVHNFSAITSYNLPLDAFSETALKQRDKTILTVAYAALKNEPDFAEAVDV